MHKVENETTGLTIYFSYETPIAFELGDALVLRENDWKQTTGKHLNYLSTDKTQRIPTLRFEEALRYYQLQK